MNFRKRVKRELVFIQQKVGDQEVEQEEVEVEKEDEEEEDGGGGTKKVFIMHPGHCPPVK